MHTIVLSKKLLNSISLPGMGRSMELNGITHKENFDIRKAFSEGILQVEFEEEPEVYHRVINLWPDPHSMERFTLFIK